MILRACSIAVLADRLPARNEKIAKTIIFLPMAISSSVRRRSGASSTTTTPGQPQIGLLNAVIGAFGVDPVPWLQQSSAHLNTFCS